MTFGSCKKKHNSTFKLFGEISLTHPLTISLPTFDLNSREFAKQSAANRTNMP